MSVPLISNRNVMGDLFDYAISSVYASGHRVFDIDFATSNEPDIYEKVRRDPIIAHALDMRLHGIAGRHWRIMPGGEDKRDKIVAQIVEDAFRMIHGFSEARYEMAQSVITGRSWNYMCGERRTISMGGTPEMAWWIIDHFKDVDRRRFRYVPDHFTRENGTQGFNIHLEMWSVERRGWEKVEHPEYFVHSVYNDEEARLGSGRGLLEALYFHHWLKTEVQQEGLSGLKRWARGQVVVKIDSLRSGSVGKDNDAVRDAYLRVLETMQARHGLVMAKDDEVQVISDTGTGHAMVMEFLRYLDDAMVRLILGSVHPFGGGGDGGSLARASVESDSSESLIQFNRDKLDEDITRDALGQLWRMNFKNFSTLGLAGAKHPTFEVVQEKREDPVQAAQVTSTLLTQGIPLRRDEVYRKTGFTPPSEEDEVITKTATPAFQFPQIPQPQP